MVDIGFRGGAETNAKETHQQRREKAKWEVKKARWVSEHYQDWESERKNSDVLSAIKTKTRND